MSTTSQSFPSFTLRDGTTFTSACRTLAEAYHALCATNPTGEFAQKLLASARARTLSPLQVAWLHRLATDALRPAVEASLRPVVVMLTTAAAAQKRRPRIVLRTASGADVVLTLDGEGSRAPGTVSATDGVRFPGGRFYGRIGTEGRFLRGRDCTDEVLSLLEALAANPLAVAAQHGCATGSCCFCGRPLSTAESRSAGYGPICADKFGLAWGDTSAADAADAEARAAGAALGQEVQL